MTAIPPRQFGTLPGVVVQALATESLLQNRALSPVGRIPLLFGAALIAASFAFRLRRFAALFPLVTAASLITLFLAPIAVESYWPMSLDSAVLLSAALFSALFRLAAEMRHSLRRKALLDVETGLPNRRAIEEALDDAPEEGVSLFAVSIDRYDHICSLIGSEASVALLCGVSARIHHLTGQPVYRIADDSLAWAMPAGDTGDRICELVAEGFRDPVGTGAGDIDVQLTLGIHPSSGLTASVEVERVLSAVISARATGRKHQRFEQATPAALRELSLMGELRRAIAEGDVSVAYQPQLNIQTGKIDQAEALVRWKHPTEGFISPDHFLPLAETTGVMCDLTRFVLTRVIEDLRSDERIRASVNISATDICEPGFADGVAARLVQLDVAPSRLTLEITESVIIASPETAVQALETLRTFGIRLSIDDYGTGQSTLSYVRNLPIHELKIDKSFVTLMRSSRSDLIMVESTIDLAHRLNLSVVAEGIEDGETLSLLSELGCDYAQGYLIGKAMTFGELALLARRECKLRDVA